jgi:hypothetical protein
MSFVYVVVENGIVYPSAYTTYSAARTAVIEKYKDAEANDINELPNTETGDQTELYIEKGIHIIISKLPVASSGGNRLRRRRRTRRTTK